MNKIKNNGFTLVELIIVITIIAILWTIWFISFSSYTSKARDTVRISDIKNLTNSIIVKISDWFLPEPSKITVISYSWSNLWKQWEVDENTISKLDWFTVKPKDPSTWENYWYSTTYIWNNFQLLAKLEWDLAYNSIIIKSAYADWNNKTFINWNYNWLFLVWNDKKIFSSPSLFTTSTWVIPLSWSTFLLNNEFNWALHQPKLLAW